MAKAYVGVGNKARRVEKIYIGVGGKARQVIKAYIGVNGVARQCYQASLAPNITKISHTCPTGLTSGARVGFQIRGAVSQDGSAVVYAIRDITGGLAFSKTSGIAENEVVYITAPAVAGVVGTTFNIVAMSSLA